MKRGDTFITAVIMLLILLVASLLVVMSNETLPEWQVPAGETILSAKAGDEGAIYLLTGDPAAGTPHTLISVSRDGVKRWELDISKLRHEPDAPANVQGQIVSVSSTAVYVYVYEEGQNFRSGVLHAISPTGDISWTISHGMDLDPPRSIHECANQVYIYISASKLLPGRQFGPWSGHELIADLQGNVRWKIEKADTSPAISPDGYVYSMFDNSTEGQKSSSINAYFPNGTLYWSKQFNHSVIDSDLDDHDRDYYLYTRSIDWLDTSGKDMTIPVYHNNTIYLVYYDEIIAFDPTGNIKWDIPLNSTCNTESGIDDRYVPYWPVLFDSGDNLNVLCIKDGSIDLLAVSPGGEISAMQYDRSKDYLAAYGNCVYYVNDSPETYWYADLNTDYFNWSNLQTARFRYPLLSKIDLSSKPDQQENISAITISWDDINDGKTVSSVTLPIGNIGCATVTNDNVDVFFEPEEARDICIVNIYNDRPSDPLYHTLNTTTPIIFGHFYLDLLPSDNLTYVSLYTYNTQDPVILGSTKIYYYSAIYAIDRGGNILWTKPTDFGADLIDADNTTVYYSTNDGRISSAGMYVAGGITIAGILYMALKFFSAGFVTRARTQLDKNENRNTVMQFVIQHPGSTLRDIARGLEMNLGTIRYHMLILGLNHKTVSFQSDGKHVRYFQNSNTYSREEQLVLSLAKREKIRYLLKIISEKPGMSNREIAHALELKESAVSRYMKELARGGVVEKAARADGGTAYSVRDNFKKHVESAVKQTSC